MQRLFIADLHLTPQSHHSYKPLQQLIDHNPSLFDHSDEIYFLGDIFEYWLGMDHAKQSYPQELALIKQLGTQTNCYFMRGNRDVLFSQEDAKALNVTLIEDPYIIDIESTQINTTGIDKAAKEPLSPASGTDLPVLLTHGDLWSGRLLDRLFRSLMNTPIIRSFLRRLSLKQRTQIAHFLRRQSRGDRQQDSAPQPDPNTINQHILPTKVLNPYANFNYFDRQFKGLHIICGHFHRPGIYQQGNLTIYQLGNLRYLNNQASIYALITHTKPPQLQLQLIQ